jgi:hypothetical protein
MTELVPLREDDEDPEVEVLARVEKGRVGAYQSRVLAQEILSQQLLVATEDNRRVLIPASDIVTVLKAGTGRRLWTCGYPGSADRESAHRTGLHPAGL